MIQKPVLGCAGIFIFAAACIGHVLAHALLRRRQRLLQICSAGIAQNRFLNHVRYTKKKRKKPVFKVRGTHHDLKDIYDQINADYFENKVNLPITWFGSRTSRPRARLTFGSYNPQSGLIKIHRLLDLPHVPRYFVSFIVYHEMLHHLLPPRKKKRRREVHHQEFIKQEKRFKEYPLAVKFKNEIVRSYFR